MGALSETMLDSGIRSQVVSLYAALIGKLVAAKSGPSGMMIKAGYKGLKGVKPGYVEELVETLLPSFMAVLDAHYADYLEADSQTSFDAWIAGRSQAVAEQLLGVTDKAVRHADNKIVVTMYQSVRKIAVKHVSMAVPEMAAVTMNYMD